MDGVRIGVGSHHGRVDVRGKSRIDVQDDVALVGPGLDLLCLLIRIRSDADVAGARRSVDRAGRLPHHDVAAARLD